MSGVNGGPNRIPVVAIGVPMAINVRDVLRTDAFSVLASAPIELHIFSPAAGNPRFRKEFTGPRVFVHELRRPTSSSFARVDRWVARAHVLIQSVRCDTVAIMVAPQLARSPVARFAHWMARAVGRRGQNLLLKACHAALRGTMPDLYGDVFAELRPDLVVGTRVLSMAGPMAPDSARYLDRYLVLDAARRGVPVAALVASWDNLTSQGFFPCPMDHVVVWNARMRAEAIEIHEIQPSRITVTGAAQHDVYRAAPYSDRASFLRSRGLDPDRATVVYTTQTRDIVPEEPLIAEAVYRALHESGFTPVPQLLIRVHQLDRPERYGALANMSGVAIDQAGLPSLPEYPDRHFDQASLRSLADTLAHADVVVNTASSISIDAAAVDSPVVVVGFDPGGTRPYADSVRRFYDYTHQKPILASGGVRMARSPAELAAEIRRYLEDPTLDADGRRRLVDEQCHSIDGESGRRVGEALLGLLRPRSGPSAARTAALTPSPDVVAIP